MEFLTKSLHSLFINVQELICKVGIDQNMKTSLINKMCCKMTGLIIVIAVCEMSAASTAGACGNENDSTYIVIGDIQDRRTVLFEQVKRYELVSGDERCGKTKIYLPFVCDQINLTNVSCFMIKNGIASNIIGKVMLLDIAGTIPSVIGPKDGRRQIFVAKHFVLSDGFSNNIPDTLLLEVIYEKSFRIKEGTPGFEKTLKQYEIQLPTNLPSAPVSTNQTRGSGIRP